MDASWRRRLAIARPLALFGAALASATLLPLLAYRMTGVSDPSGYGSVLLAHVAWSRIVALALVVLGALSLRRLALRAPRHAAHACMAVLVVGVLGGVAGSAPAYDAWLVDDMMTRYLAVDGWTAEGYGRSDEPTMLMFVASTRLENHTGPVELALPPLRKGDEYRALAVFQSGEPRGFWRSDIGQSHRDTCETEHAQLPRGHPDSVVAERYDSFAMRKCAAGGGDGGALVASWGTSEPTTVQMTVLLHPVFDRMVLARLDTSLVLVSVAGALGAFVGFASGFHRRAGLEAPPPRAAIVALAAGPSAACATWTAAAFLPRSAPYADLPPMGWSLLAAAGGLFALSAAAWGLARAARAGTLHDGRALQLSAFAAVGVAILAPLVAMALWSWAVIWVVMGMALTVFLAALAFREGHRLRRAAEAGPIGPR